VDQQPGARSVLQVVRAARRAAGLSRIRLHDVRHSYATAALPAGIPAKIVSERLGHASVAITMGTYSHVLPGLAEPAAGTVAQLILGNHAARRLPMTNR
jgi:integrase